MALRTTSCQAIGGGPGVSLYDAGSTDPLRVIASVPEGIELNASSPTLAVGLRAACTVGGS